MQPSDTADAPAPWEPPYLPTVPALLREAARRYGGREAQVHAGQRISFEDFERQSAEMARGLLALGVGKGARVAILMPNGLDFTLTFMAAARIGALVAPLSTLYQAPELAWVLRQADIQMLLTADRYLRHDYLARLEEALPSLVGQSAGELALPEAPYLRSILVWGECDRTWAAPGPAALAAAADARPRIDEAFLAAVEAEVSPADLLCMIHTSGSTAEPKGVVHTHGAMIRHSHHKCERYWGLVGSDRMISVRPLFWIAGLAAVLFHNLITGCALIFAEDPSAATAVKLIETESANALCGNGAWIRKLRDEPALAAAGYGVLRLTSDTAAIARLTNAGPVLLNPERAHLNPTPSAPPDEAFANAYGMTETLSSHTSLPRGQQLTPDKKGSCGRPMPGVTLKVVDEATGAALGTGQIGELLVRGYCLMDGLYKKDRDETFTPDGFYPTGDIGWIDEDGHVFISHRRGEMLKISGANVAPAEVEQVLNALPQVARSAVVGLPTSEGILLAAAVEATDPRSFDEGAIREALRTQLSSYKVPRRIWALPADAFPLTGSGKVRKSELIPMLSALLEAEQPAPAQPSPLGA
jgi:acyl-CoA synthetase (AMP-forming)/AMP-acid ligase II